MTQKEVVNILTNLASEIGTSFCIEDANHKSLIGTDCSISGNRYPVNLLTEVIGWVIGNQKTATIASLLSYLAQQQYEKKLLAHELLEKYQEIDLFHDISTQVTASLAPKEVARLVVQEARKLIQSTNGLILLLDENTGRLEILWEDGVGSLAQPLLLGEGIIDIIVQARQGEIVNNVTSDSRFLDSKAICSLICVPLITKKQILGAIILSSDIPTNYSTEDLKLLTILALQTATAIEKALLYEQNYNALHVAQEQAHQLQQTLFELQQTQTKLIQSEKMSNLGQLIADVAHEINNPINFVNGNLTHAQQYSQEILEVLQLYQKHYPQPVPEIQDLLEAVDIEFLVNDFTNLLSSMHLGIGRIRQLTLSLRNFSRLDQVDMKPVNLHEGIDSTLLILQSKLKPNERHSGIQVVKEYGDIPLVEGYANQLNQVFMNIIANAIDALEEGNKKNDQSPAPTIHIRTMLALEQEEFNHPYLSLRQLELSNINLQSNLKFKNFPGVVVLISDNGIGMDETVRDHLFEPFFTTKSIGKGTGLGLSISHQIIQKHGGLLQCISQPGQGTTFWIQIPIKQIIQTESTTVQMCNQERT
ncbi:sensor histidine kinase [Iningainema tapete]|uniref:sensor histidine kinase n=1 Tax=Iningainema tapete TaxID=2806730 RepID=UPI0030801487